MKAILLGLLFALLPLQLFAASGTAIPGGVHATAFVINKPGAYYLAGNRIMTTKGAAAIQVQTSDVTLDLNGCTLSYSDIEGLGTGISAKDQSNIEIRNGSLTAIPRVAVEMTNCTGVRVFDVRFDDVGAGIGISGGGSLVERCHVLSARGSGVALGGNGNVLKDSHIRNIAESDSGSGAAVIVNGSHCSILDNFIHGAARSGISSGGMDNVIRGNRLTDTNTSDSYTSAAIAVYGSRSHVEASRIHQASGMGILISEFTSHCLIERNVISEVVKIGPLVGAGIASNNATTLVRGNTGLRNDGGLVVGAYTNGGENVGN